VLVASPQPATRNAIVAMLTGLGAQARAVDSSTAVLEAVAAAPAGQPYSMLLMDTQLADGFATVQRLRMEHAQDLARLSSWR